METKKSMKKELKHSKLIDKEKDRKYLLGISPLDLCVEFQENQNDTFDIVCKVLLGVRNPETIFENQFLRNKVCLMYSFIAQIHNKNAIAYALMLGDAARYGGMREESFKDYSSFSTR